jgi:hypothetical protein
VCSMLLFPAWCLLGALTAATYRQALLTAGSATHLLHSSWQLLELDKLLCAPWQLWPKPSSYPCPGRLQSQMHRECWFTAPSHLCDCLSAFPCQWHTYSCQWHTWISATPNVHKSTGQRSPQAASADTRLPTSPRGYISKVQHFSVALVYLHMECWFYLQEWHLQDLIRCGALGLIA